MRIYASCSWKPGRLDLVISPLFSNLYAILIWWGNRMVKNYILNLNVFSLSDRITGCYLESHRRAWLGKACTAGEGWGQLGLQPWRDGGGGAAQSCAGAVAGASEKRRAGWRPSLPAVRREVARRSAASGAWQRHLAARLHRGPKQPLLYPR